MGKVYHKHGIDGLYPKVRSNKDKLRKLSYEAKDYIIDANQKNWQIYLPGVDS